jgi:hypothetical protein
MNKAPKKIWMVEETCWSDHEQPCGEIPYIREDVVLGLANAVEAAREVFRVYQTHHENTGDEKKAERNKFYADQMEAALKALDDAEIGRGMK